MEYTDGSMKFKVRRFGDDKGGGLLPGAIIAFSGSFSDDGYPINKGTPDKDWHLCDGTNGTPDLRGRFILGASASHAKGTTGGKETHTLTESELPRVTVNSTGTTNINGQHHHVVYGSDNLNSGGESLDTQGNDKGQPEISYNTSEAGGHDHIVTASGTFGGGQAHSIMPPFYTLSYIMKL